MKGLNGLKRLCKELKVWKEADFRAGAITLGPVLSQKDRNLQLLRVFSRECNLAAWEPVEGAVPFMHSEIVEEYNLVVENELPRGLHTFFPFESPDCT